MKRLALLAALTIPACDAPTSGRPQASRPKQAEAPDAKPPPKAVAASPSTPAPGPGPLPSSDAPRVRRSAVLAVLGGGPTASSLPVRATDPDRPFDPDLARAMAPTRTTGVPTVRHGDRTVDGDLPEEVVRRIVRAHTNELRFCYARQLQRKPDAEGDLEMTFTVEPSGALGDPEASADAFDTLALACITKSLKRWRFPKPGDGQPVEVSYTVALSAG